MNSVRTIRKLKKLGSNVQIPDMDMLNKIKDANINSKDLRFYKKSFFDNKKRRVIIYIRRWSAIAAILVASIFIGGVNFSPSFAGYMSQMPGIGRLADLINRETYSMGRQSPGEYKGSKTKTANTETNILKSYNRVGSKGLFDCSYETGFNSFNDAITRSYDILDFTILEWLEEDSDGMPKTFFIANVNHSYKNTVKQGDEIIIRQNGNSKETLRGFPLFKEGDRILAFVNYYGENSYYWLINDDLYIFDYIEYENESYWLKRDKVNFGDMKEYEIDSENAQDIITQAKKKDPILTKALESNDREVYKQVFDFDLLSSEIERRMEKS